MFYEGKYLSQVALTTRIGKKTVSYEVPGKSSQL